MKKNQTKETITQKISHKALEAWGGAMEIINTFIMPVVSRVLLGVGFAGFIVQNVKGMNDTIVFTGAVVLSSAMVARSFKK